MIVIVSGKSDPELQRISRVADANAVLSKSNLGELVPTLTRHLSRAEAATSSA